MPSSTPRDYFRTDGIAWDTVELDKGERIPSLDPYDMMLVMGGPQDVWQEAEHHWLAVEKVAIRTFVFKMKRPYLGICLGHQFLAEAIGGKVALAGRAEVGVMPVNMTPAGRADPLFRSLADPLTVLQWHSAEVRALPSGAKVLAWSDDCHVQAFRYGSHAYGLQYHMEITRNTVLEWGTIPKYAAALEKILGPGAMLMLQDVVARKLPEAKILCENLMSLIRPNSSSETVIQAYA